MYPDKYVNYEPYLIFFMDVNFRPILLSDYFTAIATWPLLGFHHSIGMEQLDLSTRWWYPGIE
jgi:hypothetical protein